MQWLTPHTPHVNFTARAECGFIAFMIWTRIQGPAIDAELFPRPA